MDKENKIEGGWLKKSYYNLAQAGKFLGSFLLLVVRLYWGGMLIMTGLGKWMNASGVADYFASLHLPFPLITAYVIGTIEFLGGISLVLGLFSRFFSLLLVIILAGAYATAHREVFVNFFSNLSSFTMQDPFLFLYAALLVFCFGPGFISLDYWIEKRAYGKALNN